LVDLTDGNKKMNTMVSRHHFPK